MLRALVLLEDVEGRRPDGDPFVQLVASHRLEDRPIPGIEENLLVRSFLVPPEFRDQCAGRIQISEFSWWPERGFVDDSGDYDPDEVRTIQGVPMEIVVRWRVFDGSDLSYWGPVDRLVTELRLHATSQTPGEDRRWIDPTTSPETLIIRAEPAVPGDHPEYVEIRLAELREYLGARGQGLFVMRFVERMSEFPEPIPDLPPEGEFHTVHGRKTWHPGWHDREASGSTYLCRLWESFWIEPPPRTRVARPGGEFHNGVEFTLRNGDRSTFGDDESRYWDPLSFPPSILRQFEFWGANHRVEWTSLTKCLLRAPGICLSGGINDRGQFQTLFGNMAQHPIETQELFAPHSEPMSAELSQECVDTWECGRVAASRSLQWTISQALAEVCRPWNERYGETLLLAATEEEILDPVGPTGNSFDVLANLGLDWRRALIPEAPPQRIKADIDLSGRAPAAEYNDWGTIKVTRRLFERYAGSEDGAMVLHAINELRRLRGHPVGEVESILPSLGLPDRSPRSAYLTLLCRLCSFLLQFRQVSEQALNVQLPENDRRPFTNPWRQLQLAEAHFRRLSEL